MHKATSYSLVDGGGGAAHREVEAVWKGNTGRSRGGESIGHGAVVSPKELMRDGVPSLIIFMRVKPYFVMCFALSQNL